MLIRRMSVQCGSRVHAAYLKFYGWATGAESLKTDEYGAIKPLATAAIALTIQGPGEIIGDNPFSLSGGVGAVWIKTRAMPGVIRLSAKHPRLGSKTVEIRVTPRTNTGLLL